jgi:hypothetical protein
MNAHAFARNRQIGVPNPDNRGFFALRLAIPLGCFQVRRDNRLRGG